MYIGFSTRDSLPRSKWSLHHNSARILARTRFHVSTLYLYLSIYLPPQLGVKCHCCTSKASLQSEVAAVPPRRLLFCHLLHGYSKCRAHAAAPSVLEATRPTEDGCETNGNLTLNLRLRPMPPPTGHCTAPLRRWSPCYLGASLTMQKGSSPLRALAGTVI